MTIALYQQDIVWNDREANFKLVGERLSDLDEPVDIIILPETFSCGFGDNMTAMAEPQDGPSLRFAADMAQCCNALFVATWPVREPSGQVYNRLHWVTPEGSFGCYDKAHTFRVSGEADLIARGTRREVFEWRGWRIKPAICYDLRFPKWLRNEPARRDGQPSADTTDGMSPALPAGRRADERTLDYDLLIVCANWPGSRHQAWSTLLKARAIENLAYVAGVNRVGTDGAGIDYCGNSALIDYKGLPIAECQPCTDRLQIAKIDRQPLETFRRHWPFYLDFD